MFEVVNALGSRVALCGTRVEAERIAAQLVNAQMRELGVTAPERIGEVHTVTGARLTRDPHPFDGRFGQQEVMR